MLGAQRDVGALVFGQQDDLLAHRHLGRALDDDPVLGAVVVHLQAQAGAGLDHDALDLVARPLVDAVVPAPGAVHQPVQHLLAALLAAELRDDVLHVLALVAARHQHRVGGLDDDEVVDTDHADQAAGGMHQRVVAVVDDGVAGRGVAVRVLRRHLPHGFPGAEVVPAGCQRFHADVEHAGTLLHHRVVHRLGGNGGELGLAGAHEAGVAAAGGPGGAAGQQDVGPEAFQRRQPRRRAQHEHARVPVVVAAGDVLLGRGQAGLLDELRHPRAIGTDIAVAGFRAVGRDAEDHDGALGCRVHGARESGGEGRVVAHRLVGGGHHQHRVGAVVDRLQRRQRDRRRGVAAHRLQQHRGRLGADLAQLVEHQEAVFLVADDQRRAQLEARAGQPAQPRRGLLEQAGAARQHQELLREAGPRQRPQPRARAPGHDHRLHLDVVHAS